MPAFRVVDATEVPWDEPTTVGAVPSALVAAVQQRRAGRVRFGDGSEAHAVLRASFAPSHPPTVGRTVPAPPPDELVELFADPNPPRSTCAHDAPTLEVVGTLSIELRSHGRWIAADTLSVRILAQGPDPARAYVITPGEDRRAALPPWPAGRMGVPEGTEQTLWVDRATDLGDLTLWGRVDRTHTWTFEADPR